MKALIILMALLLLTIKSGIAQTKTDSAAKAQLLLTIEQILQDGAATGDTASYNKYTTADLLVVNEDGSRDSKASFLAKLHPLPKGYSGHINIVNPRFNFRENLAVVNFVADEYENVLGQQLHTTYGIMDTYVFAGNEWKITNLQIYEIPQLPEKGISVDPDLLREYCGTYYMTPDVSYTVSLENGRLFGHRKGGTKEELLAETNSVFFRRSDTRGRKLFFKGADGVWRMHERRNAQDLVWEKK
ncbi:MAG: DUF4440 domain-containing protein [Bacteroidota bacterium]|nr:DUF4440 domain-containing protein [Bacteroidota bacterium]